MCRLWLDSTYLLILGQSHILNTPAFKGTFEPSWDSLEKYQVPDWFRDAKFGMWAHWGPQCEPEAGNVVELGMEGLGTSKQVAVAYSK